MITPYLNLLSPNECSEIIHNTIDKLKPLQVGIESTYDPGRIGDGTIIYSNPPLIQKIKNIVSKATNLPIENQEPPNVIRYKVGGLYKEHNDFLGSYKSFKGGGDRKYSCLFYLNNNFKGGETYFPHFNLKIGPTIGTLVKWDNLLPDGTGNPNLLHAGLPVTEGEKWILIIWVNEKQLF